MPPLRRWALALALICAGAVAAAPVLDLADAKKKKVNRRVGTYKGTIETGGTVSFRITKKRKVVDFTAAEVPQRCYTNPPEGQPGTPEQPKGTVTFTAPKMALEGAARFFYANFTGIPSQALPALGRLERVQGKPDADGGRTALKGKVFLVTTTGVPDAPGTEHCTTGEPEWTADKIGGKKRN